MLRSLIDHLVVTAPDLESGVDYVRATLGIEPTVGGEHASMGTHNRVLKLGAGTYLEVIAIDPAAPPLKRPRWFDLDQQDPHAVPRLATWVLRTTDITAAIAASTVVSGYPLSMSRGDYRWTIAVPRNGGLPLNGVAPTLIQWQGEHPTAAMPDSGCSLVRIEGFHPRAGKVKEMLDAVGFQGEFSVAPLPPDEGAYLIAHIRTPQGIVQLGDREVAGQVP